MITLGIDIGTTHTKALALETGTGRTLAVESAPTPLQRDERGEAHRPTDVLEMVMVLTRRVASSVPSQSVVALCVASVGEEVVLLDETGAPLGDVIAWYDPRGFEEAAAFLAGPGGHVDLSRRWPPDPTFSLFKLLWTRQHEPEAILAAATWTDLGDYVLHGFGGELVMDWSHASRAGAFDIVERSWDEQTIGVAGLELAFPRLVPSGTIIGRLDGRLAERVGLPPDVALVAGGHDHLCAAYGAGIRSTRELFLSAGTSEAHLALLEAPLPRDAGRGIDQGCYVDGRTWYAHINIHSGHFFRQWRELLYPAATDSELYAEVEAADAGRASFEPSDDLRLARFDAVPYDADRAAMMRAVLEGLARRSAAIVDRLELASGSPFQVVLTAGHPTRVALWRALRKAAYARPMAVVDEPEPTAFGAAVLAAQAVGADGAGQLVAGRTDW